MKSDECVSAACNEVNKTIKLDETTAPIIITPNDAQIVIQCLERLNGVFTKDANLTGEMIAYQYAISDAVMTSVHEIAGGPNATGIKNTLPYVAPQIIQHAIARVKQQSQPVTKSC